MKKLIKTSLIIIALALLACLVCLVWLISRPNELDAASVPDASRGPSFEVKLERPRSDRPFFGILPTKLEAKLLGGELRFDHASPGARIGSVEPDHLALSADCWDLLIEIAEKQWTLRCRPADRPVGYLHASTRAGSDLIDGGFVVEITRCEDARTGKILDTEAGGNPGQAWPSSPLTLRGSFAGLPQGHP